jgi:hypothetical protein
MRDKENQFAVRLPIIAAFHEMPGTAPPCSPRFRCLREALP